MQESVLGTILFVDDDADLLAANKQALELAGFRVLAFTSAEAALSRLDENLDGVVVSDIRMPGMDGRQFLGRVRTLDPELPVVLITGHGDIDDAVQAMRDGAYDFLAKPYPKERLLTTLGRALEARRLVLENRRLMRLADQDDDLSLIGESAAMRTLRDHIRRVAAADIDVLVQGETGVGKELVARALHRCGPRRLKPFVVVDCAALNGDLLESELFGHEMGAFPGALRKRIGRIEASDGGVLFLDEIESLPLALQGRLLRVLEEREVTPLGANEARPVSLRVITATKMSLEALASEERIRPDLFHRLNVARLRVPSLRERREDVMLLFTRFLSEASQRLHQPKPDMPEHIRRRLLSSDWPGNVRELRHLAARVALNLEPESVAPDSGLSFGLAEQVAAFEARLVREALVETNGDVRATMALLRIPRKTLYDKVKRHDLNLSQFRS